MDLAERRTRSARAEALVPDLARRGVTMVATTFVDNSGITRVKSVPVARLPHASAWGLGCSPSFDYFRFDDWLAAPPDGHAPVGDLRLVPDLDALVPLAGQPGWAWAPGDRYRQDGQPHDGCGRLLLRRLTDRLAAVHGAELKAAIEIEWVVSTDGTDQFRPGVPGPAYGMSRVTAAPDYQRDLVEALLASGVEVEQFHPEYAASQFEVSVAARTPLTAADLSVLTRTTIRAVGRRYGYRTSFSPKVEADRVGNGGHVHLSLWRGGHSLMTGGQGPYGLAGDAEAFAAGVLQRLPAVLALGAPSVASYLRLVPSHWAGAYACWGLENREAAVRMIVGSTGSEPQAANLEVKCVDLSANPYLLLAALLACGSAGIADHDRLPEPVGVDPAALPTAERDARGIHRLPGDLSVSTAALAADPVLRAALGAGLMRAILAVRRSEIALFAGCGADDVVRAQRWVH